MAEISGSVVQPPIVAAPAPAVAPPPQPPDPSITAAAIQADATRDAAALQADTQIRNTQLNNAALTEQAKLKADTDKDTAQTGFIGTVISSITQGVGAIAAALINADATKTAAKAAAEANKTETEGKNIRASGQELTKRTNTDKRLAYEKQQAEASRKADEKRDAKLDSIDRKLGLG